jgi:outer membrane protein assembly factor BamB
MNKSSHSPKGRDHAAALIDPYGIYGTRTAHRLRNMRRRQRAQQFILVLIILGIIALGIYSWRMHRIPALKPKGIWPLLISPSATPAWDAQYQTLLIPTKDGQVAAAWPMARPVRSQIWLETDFPLRGTPVLGEKYFYVGSENGTLYALERGSGKLIWQYHSGASITTQPQLSGNLIFCGNDGGWLAALRADSGELVWKRRLPAAIGDGLAVISQPSKVVLVPLTDGAAWRGGVWAFNANNGLIQWKFPANGAVNAQQITAPVAAVINGKTHVFCANDTGALINLNAASGKYDGGNDGWKIYLSAANAENARLLLRRPPLPDNTLSPTRLYLAGNDDAVRCVDIYNGRLLWKWQAPAMIIGNPQLAQGQLLVPCRGMVSYLLNAANGQENARITGTRTPFAAMLNVDNSLWALDANGTLLRYQLSNP